MTVMKTLVRIVLATVALATASIPLAAAGKSTLAVLPFTLDQNIRQVVIGNTTLTARTIENEFTNQLTDVLVRSRKFNVLDRGNIDKVIEENRLTESDWALPGQEQKIGKLLVADYLVIGYINRLEFLLKPVNIKITGENTVNVVATFKVQFRVVEVANGQLVFSKTLIEKLKSRDVRKEIPIEERKDWTLSDYKDYLFKKTAVKAANSVLAGIYPVRVAAVNNDGTVVLNRGDGAGIAVDDEYRVFNVGTEIKDPDTGESLGTREVAIGKLKVTSVQPKFSAAKILESTDKVNVNAICRPIEVNREAEAPPYPKATPGW